MAVSVSYPVGFHGIQCIKSHIIPWHLFAGKIHGAFHITSHGVPMENFTCLFPHKVPWDMKPGPLQDRRSGKSRRIDGKSGKINVILDAICFTCRGGSTGGARGRLPPRRLLAKKSRRQADVKVGFISPRLHQNSPFELKNRNIFCEGHSPLSKPSPVGRGTPLSTPHTPRRLRRLDTRAYGARFDSRLHRSTSAPTAPPFAP